VPPLNGTPGDSLAIRESLLCFGELLQGERVADVVEGFVTSEALGLVHAGPVLFVGRENSVVPVFIPQHLWDVVAPARVARHRLVQEQLVRHKETIAAGDWLVAVEFGCVYLYEQYGAIRQRLTRFRGRERGLIGIIVTHLFGRGEIDRVVL